MGSEEIWLPVPGYPGYEVSDYGRARSIDREVRSRWGTPKVLKGKMLSLVKIGSSGESGRYWSCVLYRDGERRQVMIHNLVLEVFVGPRPDGLWGLHRDDDPDNNTLSNLYWGTPTANIHDKIRNGNHHEVNKTHCPRGHEYVAENIHKRTGHRANQRQCKICHREQDRERYRRKREAAGFEVLPPLRERTHCLRGHPYDDANTYVTSAGARQCRECARLRKAAQAR